MRLLRTRAVRCRTASADELGVRLVDSLHAFAQRLHDRGGRLDVGEPHGLARLAEDVDVGHSRLADVLDGLEGFFLGGGLHVCVVFGAFRHKNNTTVWCKAIGSSLSCA